MMPTNHSVDIYSIYIKYNVPRTRIIYLASLVVYTKFAPLLLGHVDRIQQWITFQRKHGGCKHNVVYGFGINLNGSQLLYV